MSEEAAAEAESTPDASKKPRRHFGRNTKVVLAPERARRQGQITHLAFTFLGGKEEALAFLNTHHPRLGARPLDLATDSKEGFLAVESELQQSARSLASSRMEERP